MKIKEELETREKKTTNTAKKKQTKYYRFIIENKDSIRVEDLKINEPVYRCYREKGNCHICNKISNIICINCNNQIYGVWLCTNHWQQHTIEK